MTELDLQTSNKNPSESSTDGNNNMDEYDIVLLEFIEELKAQEDRDKKKRRILQLKDILLRAGFDPQKISSKITKDLQDRDVSPQYIRKVLGVEFKDPSKIRATVAQKHLLEESSIPEEPREETTTTTATTCNHEPYIEHLKQQIKELKAEIEAKDKEIAELKGRQPTTSSSSANNPAVFSSKTHEDYYNRKYRIKKH